MADSQEQHGGHESELTRAATAMAEAITAADTDALRKSASDHAAALGSQATAMAASIARPVYGKLEEIAAVLRAQGAALGNMRQADLDRRVEQHTLDTSHRRRLYDELDKLEAGQAGILAVSEETATGLKKLSGQVGDMGQTLVAVVGEVSDLKETQHDHTLILAAHDSRLMAVEGRVTAVELEQLAIRREIKRLAGDFARNTAELQRLNKEHGGGV